MLFFSISKKKNKQKLSFEYSHIWSTVIVFNYPRDNLSKIKNNCLFVYLLKLLTYLFFSSKVATYNTGGWKVPLGPLAPWWPWWPPMAAGWPRWHPTAPNGPRRPQGSRNANSSEVFKSNFDYYQRLANKKFF